MFADVTAEMAIYREAVFGPVLCVAGVDTHDEAIAFINANPNGKQAIAFWTQTKTVTARWFEPENVSSGINSTISMS